jgi:hypothetical protein
MRKSRVIGAVVVALGTVALAGGLIASNMGFKLNKTMVAAGQPVAGTGEAGVSADGTSTLGYPSFRQTGLNTASGVRTDIGASAGTVSKFLRSSNTLLTYTGLRGSTDFNLEAGVGYYVKITGAVNVPYIVVGSDDPSTPVALIASTQTVPEGGPSADGTNFYSYKYHATATTASALRADIGPAAGTVSKFLRNTTTLLTYTGLRGSTDFTLVPGEAYFVKVTGVANVPYIASHY